MSVDWYMGCEDCRECIHIAQDGLSGWTFYSGEPDCMRQLGKFLGEHSLCGGVHMLSEQIVEEWTEREWRATHNTSE
jgi:hypothetical protein